MARRKVVLVIVEGPSDDTALGVALNQVFDKDSVFIHIMHGDITTRMGVTPQNIVSKIGDEVKNYAKTQHFKATDFKQIIHIVDTDGAFIPDENVKEDETIRGAVYKLDGIHTSSKKTILERNINKRENLFRLRSRQPIWGIPYSVYYMSCNLDHVLFDKQNSSDEEKENDAYDFARKFKNDREGFVNYLCNSSFSVNGDYKESWEFIETGLNSVGRYTNLSICVKEEIDRQEITNKDLGKKK